MEKQQGNSLLEIILVLAVSSVLIVLAVRYFTVVDLNMRVAHAISKIDIISRASYEWLEYMQKPDFEGISADSLKQAGLVSRSDMISPWGGVIDVSMGVNKNHVKISLSKIPDAGCESLSRHLESIADPETTPEDCETGNYSGEF